MGVRLGAIVVGLCVLQGAPGCDCGEDIRTLEPDIDASPREIALSQQIVGAAVTSTVQVGNRGNGVLELRTSIEPATTGFRVLEAPDEIDPETAADVVIEFTPPTRDTQAATLVLASNDPDTPRLAIPLSGSGGPPALDIAPLTLDFGPVNEGAVSTLAFTLTNTGFDALTTMEFTWIEGVPFVVDAAPDEIPPGESAEVLVRFAPTADTALLEDGNGEIEDSLTITHADGAATAFVRGSVNLAPLALAVEELTREHVVKVGVGKPRGIDGSGSSDPEGGALSFAWALVARPDGSSAAIAGQGAPLVHITPDVVGTYEIVLVVTDENGASAQDTVTLLPRDLEVVLTWAADPSAACTSHPQAECDALPPDDADDICCGQSDLDLHVLEPGGALGDTGTCPGGCDEAFCAELTNEHADTCRSVGSDCGWANVAPDWGALGRADDPRLDVDDVRGAGPEIVSLDGPEDGAYRAVVHYCTDRIGEPTNAFVTIYVEGALAATAGPQLLAQGDAWTAATLLRDTGAWTFVTPPGVVEAAPPGLCGQ